MKKRYILETSDNCQRIALIGDCDGCVVMMDKAVDKLQDADKAIEEAYLQGKHDAEQDIARAAYDEAYQKGLDEGTARNENGCVGCKYDNVRIDHAPCIYCCNAYSNEWTAKEKSDEIKVGDEVESLCTGYTFIIHEINENCVKGYNFNDRVTCYSEKNNFKKTGRHFPQIKELIEAMKEGAE